MLMKYSTRELEGKGVSRNHFCVCLSGYWRRIKFLGEMNQVKESSAKYCGKVACACILMDKKDQLLLLLLAHSV